jgi:hypothetical protein
MELSGEWVTAQRRRRPAEAPCFLEHVLVTIQGYQIRYQPRNLKSS